MINDKFFNLIKTDKQFRDLIPGFLEEEMGETIKVGIILAKELPDVSVGAIVDYITTVVCVRATHPLIKRVYDESTAK